MSEENKYLQNSTFLVFIKSVLLGELLVCGFLLVFSLILIIFTFLQVNLLDLILPFIPPDSTPIDTYIVFISIISLGLGGLFTILGGLIAGQGLSVDSLSPFQYPDINLDEMRRLQKGKVDRLFKNANSMFLGVFLIIQGVLLSLVLI
ncbi:MAG: hypothetical protein ACFFDT_26780 [Candidatus Hodarchaeota archaeon]